MFVPIQRVVVAERQFGRQLKEHLELTEESVLQVEPFVCDALVRKRVPRFAYYYVNGQNLGGTTKLSSQLSDGSFLFLGGVT